MKTSAQEHLQAIFSQKGSVLQKIFSRYESQQLLEKAFRQDLPAAYQNQVRFLLYQAGTLTLSVNNSALLSRLTYIKADLLSHFKKQAHWAGLREIKIKIHAQAS